jgi:hypothetical protein
MQLFIGIVLVFSPAIVFFLCVLFVRRWRTRLRLTDDQIEFERLRRLLS